MTPRAADATPIESCRAHEPRYGYICTREPGHTGAHVAHDWGTSVLATWIDSGPCARP